MRYSHTKLVNGFACTVIGTSQDRAITDTNARINCVDTGEESGTAAIVGRALIHMLTRLTVIRALSDKIFRARCAVKCAICINAAQLIVACGATIQAIFSR
jgi:hypothetical protein